jgi:hypothetical protein
MPILGVIASSRQVAVADTGSMFPIASFTLGASATTVTFSNIPATYTHLQIRSSLQTTTANQVVQFRLNGDTGNNYSCHSLRGNGSTASIDAQVNASTIVLFGRLVGTDTTLPSSVVTNILDYKDTNKFKTALSLGGCDLNGTGEINIISGNWRNKNAITSIEISPYNGAVALSAGSTFSLYGVSA